MNINHIIKTRENFINLINGLSLDQINQIPKGFNNNIAWNFGHIVVTQQIICYKLSGLPLLVEEDLVEKYKKGSKPEGPISEKELENLKILALSSLENLKNDLLIGSFKEFKEYTTSFGVTLTNIKEAIEFNSAHEGMHLGYAMAQRRMVTQ
ncbi:DinB family protein [Echinicola sp. 20G]|uniref:DinB family protein n=1 Tax=Echinicola sp. 20G TaxID=2781961 RepID=UPI00191105AE|nr:DinB family protein [Echinicola sp. 20G]